MPITLWSVYRFLRDDLGIRFIQLIPIVERRMETKAVSDFSVTPGQYGRFLIAVFEEWVRHDVGETFVNMFDVALANWAGEPPEFVRIRADLRDDPGFGT